MSPLLIALSLVNLVLLVVLLRRAQAGGGAEVGAKLDTMTDALSQRFSSATADMASRLEQTKGDLRQQMADRLAQGFGEIRAGCDEIRSGVDRQLADGRNEQAARLAEFGGSIENKFESLRGTTEAKLEGFAERQAESLRQASTTLEQKFEQLSSRQAESLTAIRQEVTGSLTLTTSQLKTEMDTFNQRMGQSLEGIRSQVDEKLMAISGSVQQKLDENIREGFAHFTKVQEHLQAAEEQLRQVGALGASINDLNNLLKLPHLRGTDFGEASLNRLLADFLPANMYELQAPVHGGGRVDAMINFPDRRLPVDAKFPREQVLPLFETSENSKLAEAREQLVRVLKAEAKRIAEYIQPEHGTTDVALMYLPSETLYFEAVTSAETIEALSKLKIFPVSPNTLMMTLHTIALAYKWYEVAMRFEETRKELGKAQMSLGHFQKNFDNVGKSLDKAQTAFQTAATHLKNYRKRVTSISGEEVPEFEELAPHALATNVVIRELAAEAEEKN
jgi:DNA recombination protein RmuC